MRWLGAARRAHDIAMAHAANRSMFGSRQADLGMAIGGRYYLWPAVVVSIATGSTLADAAKIGAREKAAYLAAQRERFAQWFTAPADERAAAAA